MNPEADSQKEEDTLLSLAKANNELLIANNELLNKINRREIRQFWFKIVWFLVLLGVPFIIYYYLINSFVCFQRDERKRNHAD